MKETPKLSPTSYAMLGLLARSPQSAYELNTLMQTSLIRVYWPRAESHVYSEPKKLLAHGLVTQKEELVGGRKRSVYTITEQGRSSLGDWLQRQDATDLRVHAEFMLKLVLADSGSPEHARATLAHSLESSRSDLEEAIEGISQILSHADLVTPGMPYNGIVINLMADMLIARYRWGQYALGATADIADDTTDEDRKVAGRAAYAEALRKMQATLANC
jgi:DNA-binding PadR family transcriptional regulator